VIHTFREGIGDTRLEVACLETELLHFLTHCRHGMDQGIEEGKDCAICEGDVSYLAKGGYGSCSEVRPVSCLVLRRK